MSRIWFATASVYACTLLCIAASGQVLQGFHPEHQQSLKLASPDVTAEIIPEPRDPRTGESHSIFRIKTHARESTVSLPFPFYQVNAIVGSVPGKLVVVGMQAATVYEIGIVDVVSSRVADHFTCYTPAISPNGRYVAYTKFFAPHGAPSPDDHAMLYDVAKSPSENRPLGVGLDDHIDVGFALYPPGISNHESDNVDVLPNLAHVFAGYYFWEDPNQYFFASRSADEFKVVWVAISGSTARVRDVTIPPSQLPIRQNGFPPRLLNFRLEGDLARLSLMSTAQRTIQVDLSTFISIESVDLGKPPLGAKQ